MAPLARSLKLLLGQVWRRSARRNPGIPGSTSEHRTNWEHRTVCLVLEGVGNLIAPREYIIREACPIGEPPERLSIGRELPIGELRDEVVSRNLAPDDQVPEEQERRRYQKCNEGATDLGCASEHEWRHRREGVLNRRAAAEPLTPCSDIMGLTQVMA